MELCHYIFKSPACSYTGEMQSCTKTRACCQDYGNFAHWPHPPQTVVQVQGCPLTRETIILAALVKRLGGNIFIADEELSLLPGLIIMDVDGGLNINVQN